MAGTTRLEQIILSITLVATAFAAWLHFGEGPDLAAFAIATIALAGLAFTVSTATEQIGERFSPAVTGVMQSTFGNMPEFFIVLFALSAGEVQLATYSIVGSVFANALLVLGLAILAATRSGREVRFSTRLPNDTATLLLLAVFIIVILGISISVGDHASRHVEAISIVGAIALLVTYISWLIPYVRSGAEGDPAHRGTPRISMKFAMGMLAVSGVGAALVSDWFVHALNPAIDKLGVSQAFAGLVIVAIAGNAVENASGVVLAYKGQTELALSVVKNSVAQIAVFLFPLLILCSFAFDQHLTFAMPAVYMGALAFTALCVWQITSDGVVRTFEGVALIAFYVVLATVALYE